MNSGKIVAGGRDGWTGRVDGTDEGSIRGPRGPKNWEEVQELLLQSVINAMSPLLVCGRCELLFQFHTSLNFSNSNDTWLSFELETVALSLCICFSLILLSPWTKT